MIHKRICDYCGKEYEGYRKRFCSKDCKAHYKTNKLLYDVFEPFELIFRFDSEIKKMEFKRTLWIADVIKGLHKVAMLRKNRLKKLMELNAPKTRIKEEKEYLQKATDALLDDSMYKERFEENRSLINEMRCSLPKKKQPNA